MGMLVIGLVLFLGIHTVSIVAPQWREATDRAARRGPVEGHLLGRLRDRPRAPDLSATALARANPVVLYTPPTALRHVALLLMLPVFPLLFAAYLPGRIKAIAKHPMLLATKLWAMAHLLANGTLADVLLFGGFLAWAVADRISVKRAAAAAHDSRRAAAAVQRRDRRRRRAGPLRAVRRCGRTAGCSASRRCLRYSSRTALQPRHRTAPRGHPRPRAVRRRAVPVLRHGLRHAAEPSRCARRRSAHAVHEAPYKAPPKSRRAVREAAQHAGRLRATRSQVARRRAGARGRRQPRARDRPHARAASPKREALDHVAGCVIVADCQRAARRASTGRRSASRRATASARSGRRVVARSTRSAIPDGWRSASTSTAGSSSRELDRRLDPVAGAAARRRHRLHDARARRHPDDRRARTARRACAPDSAVAIEIDGLGRLENRFVATARGGAHEARPRRLRRRHARGDAARRRRGSRSASPTAASSPRTPSSGCRRSRSAP